MLKVATVCSGIGSPEQALRDLDIPHQISFACEIDKYARQTYLANFQPQLMLEDMTKQDWQGDQFSSDIFIGGIPCQTFSIAGKRQGEADPRGTLFYDFYRYVEAHRPRVFIIENVQGLLSHDKGRTFDNWMRLLGHSENGMIKMFPDEKSLGYNLHYTILNSKDFGVPQSRPRIYIVGIREDLPNTFRFPKGWKLGVRLKDILEPVVTQNYYLTQEAMQSIQVEPSNQMSLLDGFAVKEATKKGYSVAKAGDSVNTTNVISKTRRGRVGKGIANTLDTGCNQAVLVDDSIKIVGQINSSQDGQILDTDGISTCLTSGHNNQPKIVDPGSLDLAYTLTDKKYGKEANRRVYSENGIAPTLTTMGGGNREPKVMQLNQSKESGGVQPYQQNRVYSEEGLMTALDTEVGRKSITSGFRMRKLTPLECMRLQGFPDSFVKPCSNNQIYKQSGNTMTKTVIEAILKKLYESSIFSGLNGFYNGEAGGEPAQGDSRAHVG